MPLPSLATLSLTPAPPVDIGTLVGEKRKAKLPRTKDSGLVKLLPTQDDGSLDTNGVASLELPKAVGSAEYVNTLGVSINDWFQTNLALMLKYDSHEGPPETLNHKTSMFHGKVDGVPGQPQEDILSAYAAWNNLTPEQQQAYMKKVDLSTREGRQLLFDVAYLDKQTWFKEMPGAAFFKKAMRYVKQGNSGYGQANMPNAWISDGFGMWAHVAADVGFPMLVEAMKLLEAYGLEPGLPKGFPHPIWKPPKGEPLAIHHDQMPPATLIANLRAHGSGNWTTWVKKYGFQLLAHLEGGTGIDDGATFVVGPLTPAALLVCMEAYNSESVGVSKEVVEAWREKPSGPWKLDWEQHLDAFNSKLNEAGHPSIGLIPAAPHPAHNKGHLLMWPVGFPHGSFANQKGGRFTVTLPTTVRGSGQRPDPRLPTRLRYLAILSSNGHTREQYAEAERWLAQDGRMTKEQRAQVKAAGVKRLPGFGPYSDGKTHEEPFKAIPQIRSPDAARLLGLPVGPLWRISVKPATLDLYNEALARVEAGESLLGMAAASSEAGPSSAVPEPMELEPDDVEDEASDDSSDEAPRAKMVRISPPPPAPLAEARPTGPRAPPTAAVLDAPNMTVVKILEPWATAIVTGQKDVENRGNLSQPNLGRAGDWVLIAASKPPPTGPLMKDYIDRVQKTRPGINRVRLESHPSFASRAIVGIALIKGVYGDGKTAAQLPWPSVWYNAPDFAWVFSDAWEFETPVKLSDDDGFQVSSLLSSLEKKGFGYKERIIEELGKLEYGER